jgi:undecaprenyl diphosphate synthase
MSRLMQNEIRLSVIGRVEALPPEVQRELMAGVEKTAKNRRMRLNLAINYGGRTEIVDAVNKLVAEARANGELDSLQITEEMVSSRLYTAEIRDPDLLIRTSGEMRISNFLLWQIAYSELYVTDTLWPDFNRTELLEALLEYQSRERRFGGLSVDALPSVDSASFPSLEEEAIELPLA